MRPCEKPPSTMTRSTVMMAVGMAMKPMISRVSRRRITKRTAMVRSMDPIFSAMLQATP